MNSLSQGTLNTRDETYPLKLMKYECEKVGIDFLVHYGFKLFFSDGYSYGITSNKEWNEFLNKDSFTPNVKEHYFNNLRLTIDNKYRYRVRAQAKADSIFLQELENAGMSNSLTIYSSQSFGVITYFFVANPSNIKVCYYFYNNLYVFDKIVAGVERRLMQIGYWDNKLGLPNQVRLFLNNDKKLIFNEIQKKNVNVTRSIFFKGEVIQFTQKEMLILEQLNHRYTLKGLSKEFGIGASGVNFHLNNIREKIKAYNKEEFMVSIEQIKKLI